jgi:hypothetical protein
MNFRNLVALATLALAVVLAVMTSGGNKTRAAGPICSVPGDHGTIQAAVDDAGCSTINVAAGNYSENVTITRTLTLNGAQAGNDARGRVAAESILNGANPIGSNPVISIQAVGVTVDGFTVKNSITSNAAIGVAVKVSGNNAVITNNIFDGINTTDTGGNGTAQAIYLEAGPDGVSITKNDMKNISSARSAKGVTIGDSGSSNPSQNVVVQDNSISNITSTTRGSYGVSINNGNGTTSNSGLQILDNSISNLVGGTGVLCPPSGIPPTVPPVCGWVHAIGLEANTPGVIVSGNSISTVVAATTDSIGVFFEKNPSFATAQVNGNNFNLTAASYGIAVHPAILGAGAVNGECNWWGSPSGPTAATNPAGTGAQVSPRVSYQPWLIAAAPGGACLGGNVPTTASQCKKGGWTIGVRADGSTFKNQGDCIQYVNTGK